MLKKLADAKNVIGITDRHATVQMIGTHDHANPFRGLRRVGAVGFLNQAGVGNAAVHQVIVAHPTFAETGIGRGASSRDHHGSDALFEQVKSMIETGAVYGRRAARIFCCAKNYDSVSRMNFLPRGLANNSHTNCGQPDEHGCRQRPQPQQPKASRRPFRSRVVHPCAKNSEISWAEIAPSRMMRQRASSSVRSTMVEAVSRGEVPPSTMMEIRSCNWSRTASAVVHSDSPLRLAEVAVIGIPAACTTASGILALGTRSATLPVLAVTFNGSRDAALTMMVSGPGQKRRASL